MQILYAKIDGGNFGDDLNKVVWHALLPRLDELAGDQAILGIGTLQGSPIPNKIKVVHVLGTGGYSDQPPRNWIDDRFRFHFVRGPLTAQNWGCPTKALIDGAALVAHCHLKDIAADANRARVGFVPHHKADQCANYHYICQQADLKYISTLGGDVARFISEIKSCDMIVTEALHGAIMADLFRKPWIAVSAGPHVVEHKWHDWCHSIGLQYNPETLALPVTKGLPLGLRVEHAAHRTLYFLGWKRNRWASKRVFLDKRDAEDRVAAQLSAIAKRHDRAILSQHDVIDRLLAKAGEAWQGFLGTIN
jgi:succinoglycan biosynthesis protein ExoV